VPALYTPASMLSLISRWLKMNRFRNGSYPNQIMTELYKLLWKYGVLNLPTSRSTSPLTTVLPLKVRLSVRVICLLSSAVAAPLVSSWLKWLGTTLRTARLPLSVPTLTACLRKAEDCLSESMSRFTAGRCNPTSNLSLSAGFTISSTTGRACGTLPSVTSPGCGLARMLSAKRSRWNTWTACFMPNSRLNSQPSLTG